MKPRKKKREEGKKQRGEEMKEGRKEKRWEAIRKKERYVGRKKGSKEGKVSITIQLPFLSLNNTLLSEYHFYPIIYLS